MKTFKSIIGPVMTILIAASISFFASSACTQNTTARSQGGIGGDCASMVIVRVGDVEVTMGDLLKSPQLYMIIDEQLVKTAIFQAEANKRGIIVTPDELEKKLNDFYGMSGGEEAFLDSIPASIPRSLVPDDLRKNFTNQILQEKIMASLYDSEHGPATEEEINQLWTENGEFYRNQYVNDNPGTPTESVTLDQVREKIIADLKQRWQMENGQIKLKELIDSYDVQNVLLETYVGPEEESTNLTVPEMTGGDVGGEPVHDHDESAEHDHEHGETHEAPDGEPSGE